MRINRMLDLIADELRLMVRYEPETGNFYSRVDMQGVSRGKKLGGLHKELGYLMIGVLGKKYYAHRLAWLYVHGEWPLHTIDHINGNKADNRLENLRQATIAQNRLNAGVRKDSRSGYKGIGITTAGNFKVIVKHNGTIHHCKVYRDIESAKAAYAENARKIHGEYARV